MCLIWTRPRHRPMVYGSVLLVYKDLGHLPQKLSGPLWRLGIEFAISLLKGRNKEANCVFQCMIEISFIKQKARAVFHQ